MKAQVTRFKSLKMAFKELEQLILKKSRRNNKTRIVAGYCWGWNSKKNKQGNDIILGNFQAQWNLDDDGPEWLIQPHSIDQVGCIHTCQGLELDYVGVIIGEDLIIPDGKVLVDPSKRSKHDKSIHNYKKLLKEDPEKAETQIESIIKNTYRTPMTRGMKGCYVYCVDEELRALLQKGKTHEISKIFSN